MAQKLIIRCLGEDERPGKKGSRWFEVELKKDPSLETHCWSGHLCVSAWGSREARGCRRKLQDTLSVYRHWEDPLCVRACVCVCAGAGLSTSNWNGAASHTASLTCWHLQRPPMRGPGTAQTKRQRPGTGSIHIGGMYVYAYKFHKQAFILFSQRGDTWSGHWCSLCLYECCGFLSVLIYADGHVYTCTRIVCTPVGTARTRGHGAAAATPLPG